MKLTRQALTIVLCTFLSIVLHEFGHFAVYALSGHHVKVSLQTVKPIGPIDPTTDTWAKSAGPLGSWLFAVLFLVFARQRPSFACATAALTNASIRFFPTMMDLVRAATHAPPFSDEGDVALAISHVQSGRIAMIACAMGLSLVLSILSVREYHLVRNRWIKALGIYLFSLTVGIGVVIVDELIR